MLGVIDESDFQVSSGTFVIKFWATWCGPCKRMEPVLSQLEDEYKDTMKFISIDVDQVASLAQRYRIKSLPTLLIIKDGKEINRIPGVSLIEPLRKIFNDAIKTVDINIV